jgi:carboxylesterase type B
MFWIHGGDFNSGSARDYGYVSITDNIVSKGVLVVTVQYRLGPLGKTIIVIYITHSKAFSRLAMHRYQAILACGIYEWHSALYNRILPHSAVIQVV